MLFFEVRWTVGCGVNWVDMRIVMMMRMITVWWVWTVMMTGWRVTELGLSEVGCEVVGFLCLRWGVGLLKLGWHVHWSVVIL